MTAHSGVSLRRSNQEVARAMLITGVVLIGFAILLTFFDRRLADYVNSGSRFAAAFLLHMWGIVIQLGYPLGSFLVVGAIIVNRLPERTPPPDVS